MHVMIVAWDLSDSEATVESLRTYLSDYATEAFSELEGMRLKAWFSNTENQMWGAVYLWDSPEYVYACAWASRAIELIGYPPTSVNTFELEAAAEGKSVHPTLAGLGLAFGA